MTDQGGVWAGCGKGEADARCHLDNAGTEFLVINLKTAKALGLTIPPSILARAGEVIE